jgi:hypothetical protein
MSKAFKTLLQHHGSTIRQTRVSHQNFALWSRRSGWHRPGADLCKPPAPSTSRPQHRGTLCLQARRRGGGLSTIRRARGGDSGPNVPVEVVSPFKEGKLESLQLDQGLRQRVSKAVEELGYKVR